MYYLLFLLPLILLSFTHSKASIISLGSSLNPINNSYWSSDSGHLAFGFYPQLDGFSIGVFLPNIHQKTVIWTSNPNDPDPPLSSNDTATLILDLQGRLILRGGGGQISIAGDTLSPASSASMLDSGNFVLYDSDSNILSQTFDFPTDTILPGQRLLSGKDLVCSKSGEDHSAGRFGVSMRTNGNLVMYALDYPFKSDYFYWRLQTKAGSNVTLNLDTNGQLFLLGTNGVKIATVNNGGRNISGEAMYRATVDSDGIFRLYSHNLGKTANWSIQWQSSTNLCDPTGICGLDAYCSVVDQVQVCNCLPSFDYIDNRQKNLGCQWKSTTGACSGSDQGWNFTFQVLENVLWEDVSSQYSSLPSSTKEACRDDCFRDCNCYARCIGNNCATS